VWWHSSSAANQAYGPLSFEFSQDWAAGSGPVLRPCLRVVDTSNDIPVGMLESGDAAFRILVRARARSTFEKGVDARELTELFEVARLLPPCDLPGAAAGVLEVLLAGAGDRTSLGR